MKSVFFKIVVPNFNNFEYLSKCLDSILSQTFLNYCVIIIDDQSTDKSWDILTLYNRKYPTKVFIHQVTEKLYAGGCRNIGINWPISSQYTLFIDSDDWLYDNNVLQQLHDEIILHNFPKLIRCPLIRYNGKRYKPDKISSPTLLKMLTHGASPSRNCVKSDIHFSYIKQRSISNDVVGFLRMCDQIKFSDIYLVSFSCVVYNLLNTKSCQHNANIKKSYQCIIDKYKLIEDLTCEKFQTADCNTYKNTVISQLVKEKEKMYNSLTINDVMNHSFVISIDADRYTLFNKLFSSFTVLPTLKIGYTQHKSAVENCKESHIQIVKYANEHNWPYVMIFEDDAYPCKNVIEKFTNYLQFIPKDSQLILFGWSNHRKSEKQNFSQMYNKITTWTLSGTHAYMIFKSGYDSFLEYFKTHPTATADCKSFTSVQNSYVIDKPLFIQYCKNKSFNNHVGYIYYGDHSTPPDGFQKIT